MKKSMAYKCKVPSIEEMLEAGVHFGHQTRRWNPKMEKYIYGVDNKTHIIDLYKTQELLEVACNFLYEVAKSGKQIILVGTKRQAANIVEKYARESGTLFVTQRWLGGTFTNYQSVEGKWKQLQELKAKRDKNEFAHLTKKERLLIDRKIENLELFVGGIQDMQKYPGAIVVVDAKREKTAIKEANSVNVPVVAMVDTNTDPDNVDFVIPSNDDAIKSIELIISKLAEAIKKGYSEYKPEKAEVAEAKVGSKEVNESNKEGGLQPESVSSTSQKGRAKDNSKAKKVDNTKKKAKSVTSTEKAKSIRTSKTTKVKTEGKGETKPKAKQDKKAENSTSKKSSSKKSK